MGEQRVSRDEEVGHFISPSTLAALYSFSMAFSSNKKRLLESLTPIINCTALGKPKALFLASAKMFFFAPKKLLFIPRRGTFSPPEGKVVLLRKNGTDSIREQEQALTSFSSTLLHLFPHFFFTICRRWR